METRNRTFNRNKTRQLRAGENAVNHMTDFKLAYPDSASINSRNLGVKLSHSACAATPDRAMTCAVERSSFREAQEGDICRGRFLPSLVCSESFGPLARLVRVCSETLQVADGSDGSCYGV